MLRIPPIGLSGLVVRSSTRSATETGSHRKCQGFEARVADLSEWESGKCSPLFEPGRWAPDPATLARPRSRSQVQRHLSPEEQVEVVTMYQAGKTINAVARAFKLHRTTVTAILSRHGVKVRRRSMNPQEIDRACELYESGSPLAAVSAQLGFDAKTIADRLRERCVRIRSPRERSRGTASRR
ncbi:helix-turn-helix domain-containing protein [Demequina sp.]|uniref:helix-turn-helix domain-containing protein n=1 Tax=Demequina sp. TaxID=2050685 RepID=UPI003D10F832